MFPKTGSQTLTTIPGIDKKNICVSKLWILLLIQPNLTGKIPPWLGLNTWLELGHVKKGGILPVKFGSINSKYVYPLTPRNLFLYDSLRFLEAKRSKMSSSVAVSICSSLRIGHKSGNTTVIAL